VKPLGGSSRDHGGPPSPTQRNPLSLEIEVSLLNKLAMKACNCRGRERFALQKLRSIRFGNRGRPFLARAIPSKYFYHNPQFWWLAASAACSQNSQELNNFGASICPRSPDL